jgi:hypothetical protein
LFVYPLADDNLLDEHPNNSNQFIFSPRGMIEWVRINNMPAAMNLAPILFPIIGIKKRTARISQTGIVRTQPVASL